MSHTCPEENTEAIDQSTFWTPDGLNWDTHRIGWAIAGGCAAVTTIITIFTVAGHARNYHVPAEQRQIIRILYMPPVFAIISFFSYRFFRDYTYYSLIEVVYEAFVISAFLLLIIQYVASTASGRTAESALVRKEKSPLPIPFCCWRYRPTKAYFMYTVKWMVMQYTIVRPAVTIAGIIAQANGVLCENHFSVHFAAVYLEAVDFVSISVALYGLLMFYDITKEELKNRRPLAKFLCIKLIVMVTWYQGFVFSALQSHGVIKATQYWTVSNIKDGLNALATCIEMVLFALAFAYSYPSSEYTGRGAKKTAPWRALWDSINYSDFAYEIYTSLRFFVHYAMGKPYTRSSSHVNFEQAFGLHDGNLQPIKSSPDDYEGPYQMEPVSHGYVRATSYGPSSPTEVRR